MEITKYLEEALKIQNDYNVALLFKSITQLKVICFNIEAHKAYYFNLNTTLYSLIGINELGSLIRNELSGFMSDKLKALTDFHQFNAYGKLLSKIGSINFITNVAKSYMNFVFDHEFESKLNICKDSLNFKNGVLDTKTICFRSRTHKDYVSKCLSHDFDFKCDPLLKIKINKMMLQICNDDIETRNFIYYWMAYNLTGYTHLTKFLVIVGHLASNGKSTIVKMLENAFSIYCQKLDRQTFNIDFAKRHKQFANIKAPVRCVYMEELDRKKIDVEALKDFVDGNKIKNEVLYGTTEDILIQSKLNVLSNNYMNFDTDEGVVRRGYQMEFKNKFVSLEDYKKMKDVKGIYLRDNNIDNLLIRDDFKLAFLHILIPYLYDFQQTREIPSNNASSAFKEICDENDKMKEFIERYYVKTNNDSDRVHKDELLEMYKEHYNLKNISWQNILNDVKRLGLSYNRTLRKGSLKGCITGLKFIESEDNSADYSNKRKYDFVDVKAHTNNDLDDNIILKPKTSTNKPSTDDDYMFINDVETKTIKKTPNKKFLTEEEADDEFNKLTINF